jgi:hypothetical protein
MTAAPPVIETTENGYRCTFADGSVLEAEHVRHERQQWHGTITAIHDTQVLHRADFALLNQREQADFHRAAASLNGHFHWQGRLQSLITGILAHEQATETGEETPPTVPALAVPVDPFPLDVLPEPMRRLVEEGANALPCPPDFIAVPMLSAIAVAMGNTRSIEIKTGWIEGPRTYTGTVGDPGSKKSPAQDLAMQPLYAQQQRSNRAFAQKRSDYMSEVEVYEVALSAWKANVRKNKATAGAMPAKPEPPILTQIWTADSTIEAFAELLAHNPRGVILIRDELTAWVLSMNQYKGGRGADRQAWLSYWNGAPVIINRKGQDPIVIDRPFACVAGCLPPDVLGDLMDERGRGDGFLDRVLLAYPDPVPVTYTEAIVTPEAVADYAEVMTAILMSGTDTTTTVVTMTPSGHTAFVELMGWICDQMNSPDCPGYLRGPLAKMQGYAGRLALILQMARKASGETGKDQVEVTSVTGAAALVRYFVSHARRVYPCLQTTAEDKQVELAYAWINAHGGRATAREVLTAGVAGVKTAAQAKALLHLMADRGHGKVVDKPRGQVEISLAS